MGFWGFGVLGFWGRLCNRDLGAVGPARRARNTALRNSIGSVNQGKPGYIPTGRLVAGKVDVEIVERELPILRMRPTFVHAGRNPVQWPAVRLPETDCRQKCQSLA